jgi:hypothetical protein
LVASANPEAALAVSPVVADYRQRINEIVERAALPHDLSPQGEVLLASVGVTAGPLEPALEGAFRAMGCRTAPADSRCAGAAQQT